MVWLYLASRNWNACSFVSFLLPVLAPLILLVLGIYARKAERMGARWWISLMRWQLVAAFVYALPPGLYPGGPKDILLLGVFLLAWGTTAFLLLTALAMLMREDHDWKRGTGILSAHALAYVGLSALAWCLSLRFGVRAEFG